MEPDTAKQQRSPNTFSEIHLLTRAFDAPVIFYTYSGGKRITVTRVNRYSIQPKQGNIIPKVNIMFALPASSLNAVKSGITVQKSIKDQGLRTPEKIKDRPVVATNQVLRNAQDKPVRVVMRSGHVLRGLLVSVSKYLLVLRINTKIVLVYRHGMYEFSIED